MCRHLLLNADPTGFQLFSQTIIMYEKQGTNSDKMIVFMCIWQEPISVKFLVKYKGARLWNDKFNLVNHHLYKEKIRTTITKHLIETYQEICYIL